MELEELKAGWSILNEQLAKSEMLNKKDHQRDDNQPDTIGL